MKRKLIDRIHDRIWSEVGQLLSYHPNLPKVTNGGNESSSISAAMPWADICAAFADGKLNSRNFRRNSAVRDIVETVGAVDGRFYAKKILAWDPDWLGNSKIMEINKWGDPIRWPGLLLGTSEPFSPTTLRYLATALWLKRQGYVKSDTRITEIGVGFGGLTAMNALVSGATTTMVDLPQVENSALKMLTEVGLESHARRDTGSSDFSADFVISNYAFTELNAEIQSGYFARYIKHSAHGMIISNSSIFASSICGRTDDDLLKWFCAEGLAARLETANDLLAPGDALCGVNMILW
jgi:hypothetical protein